MIIMIKTIVITNYYWPFFVFVFLAQCESQACASLDLYPDRTWYTVIAFSHYATLYKLIAGDLSQLSSLLEKNTGKEVRLIYYRGFDIDSAIFTSFSGCNAKDVMSHIDLTKPMALYIHGFQESPSNESIRTVADAYLRRGDHNFVLVDWSDYAYDNYLSDLFQVKRIARSLAMVLDGFVQNGLPSEALHIVGHSMGGQMAGFIGKYTNFLVPRITGLDPASPGYYQFGAEHLNPSNAKFVDVIHTDGGIYGAYPATGTADCYPNGGTRPQPGCPFFGAPLSPTDLCSHWRSWRFWAESLSSERVFLAVKCDSYSSFMSGKCRKNEAGYCGFRMPNTARGEYYLTTNGQSPFGRGKNGIGSK